MLPIRLELQNFLAYRNPDPIILEDLHLACMVGSNGAGKSSLLDAITWALWGKARARSDDDMIHMGENEMQVTLDFLHTHQRFRVIRKRKLGSVRKSGGRSPGQSSLDFFSWDENRNVYSLISEPAIRETQQKINELLRLDYDIFINSAFLQQGKADAFTTKTPAQRKDILSEILGLDRWNQYEETTRDLLRNIQQEMAVLSTRITEMEIEIAEEPGLRRELEEANALLAEAKAAVEVAEASLAEVAGADIELRSAQEALATVQFNLREREKDLATLDDEIQRHEERLAIFQQVLSEAESIQAGYAQLEAARAADRELGEKLTVLNDLNQDIAELEQQVASARQEIELEVRQLQTQIEHEQKIVDEGEDVHAQLLDIDAEIEQLESLEEQRTDQQEELSGLKEEMAASKSIQDNLAQEAENIKERLNLLEQSTDPICPLCQQPLNEEQKTTLITEMQGDLDQRRQDYRDHSIRQHEIADEIKQAQTTIAEIGTALKDLPRLRSQRGGIDQQLTAAQAAATRLSANLAQLSERQSVLESEHYAEALRIQLSNARTQRESLGYDRTEHQAVREQMETYLNYQDRAKELDLAQQSTPQIEEALTSAQKRHARWTQNLADYVQQAEHQTAEIDRLEVKVAEMKRREDEVSRQRTQLRNAEEKVISVEQTLRSIDKMRVRRAEMIERRSDLAQQETVYEQLKNAFGRDGIPAMIIEAAIPELEDASNQLLGRMTNNRMHVRFDTQREKKSGGVSETLDILIADELGTRDYGMFSGGEAFRVNFALRVALSQLLARRAGAQLRTLFIDEGFGTQDDVGRERLVEAINAIQEDFDLLLVITHIDELKDAFPARIEVTKTPNGSLAVVR